MFLGIDIGTSAVKAALMDKDMAPLADASVPLALSQPHNGWSEQNPDDWWQAAAAAVGQVMAACPGPVQAIGLSGQMHGAVLLDKDRAVIRPAILWNDSRADAECAALQADHPQLATIAGVRPMPGLTAPKLMWLARHEPGAHARIAHLLLPKDYIGLRLHGGLFSDASDAAGSWWFDQAAQTWSAALQEATGADPRWFPALAGPGAPVGGLTTSAAQALGLPEGTPVAIGAGDTVAGAVALGAVHDGDGFVSLGTSGQLFVVTGHYAAAPDRGLHSFAHALPGLWYQMAAMLNGARPMQWFAEMTGAPIQTLLAEAADAPLDGVPLCLPYLAGERTPHGDSAIRAAFAGIGNGTTRGQMMRAVIEAVAYSFADAKDAVEAARPLPSELRAVGGGARADLLLQSIADVMDVTLARADDAAIGPALGAARLAGLAVGAFGLQDLAKGPEVTRRFVPDPGAQPRHSARLAQYRALYQALRPLSV